VKLQKVSFKLKKNNNNYSKLRLSWK